MHHWILITEWEMKFAQKFPSCYVARISSGAPLLMHRHHLLTGLSSAALVSWSPPSSPSASLQAASVDSWGSASQTQQTLLHVQHVLKTFSRFNQFTFDIFAHLGWIQQPGCRFSSRLQHQSAPAPKIKTHCERKEMKGRRTYRNFSSTIVTMTFPLPIIHHISASTDWNAD